MTATAAPVARVVPGDRSRAETLLVRFLGVAAFVALPVALSLLSADGDTHAFAAAVGGYSPAYLAHGAVWSLAGSAFLLPHVSMIGPTTMLAVACFLPYALARGTSRAAGMYVATHVVAAVSVALVVFAGVAVGWPAVQAAYHRVDVGAASGLAGIVGALGMMAYRRAVLAGVLVVVAALLLFLGGFTIDGGVSRIADVEHLVGLGSGVALEALLG